MESGAEGRAEAAEATSQVTLSPRHLVTLSSSLGRLRRLARKELNETLRDRRTILTLVLMPVLLYPLLGVGFLQLRPNALVQPHRVGFVSEKEAGALLDYWRLGLRHMEKREGLQEMTPPPANRLSPLPGWKNYSLDDLEEGVRKGQIDVGARLRPPGAFQARPSTPLRIECDLIYLEGPGDVREAVRYLELLMADANADLIGRQIGRRGDPVQAHLVAIAPPESGKSQLPAVLVPLVLVLMTLTGAVYPAIDLTAGERERGTLEVLVAAPIPRLSVLFAKYIAVLTVAVLTALINLAVMAGTLYTTGMAEVVFKGGLTLLMLVQVLALLLLFATFFSAVLLALTSFARSFKEAQAYLIPLVLVSLLPALMALLPGLDLHGPLAVVPLLNVVLLSRDVFAGTASLAVAAVVVATTLLYALAALSMAARIFGTEAVLSAQSGWSDLFRRRSR